MPKIIIFGDSITRWANDLERQGRVNRLREKVEALDEDTMVYNCGVSADTTDDLLKRFKTETEARQSHHPEKGTIIIFAIGINDEAFDITSKISKVPLPQFISNMQTLIAQARAFTNNIAILGLTKVDDAKTIPRSPRSPETCRSNEQIQHYDQQLQTICEQENIPFIPLQGVIEKADLDPDGLHPNAQGHQKIAEKVRKKLSL